MKILKNNLTRKKSYVLFIAILLVIALAIIFTLKNQKINNKTIKNGNNKNTKEIENYLLNIKGYKANLDVKIISNKNENNYKIFQEVNENEEYEKINEPKNIEGMEIIYSNSTLTIKNTNLNVEKIYNNYENLSNNNLFLTDFLKTYKNENKNKKIFEKNECIYLVLNGSNIYEKEKILTINKENLTPTSLEIFDTNKKRRIYIYYSNIEMY